jgi:hypothetical protein
MSAPFALVSALLLSAAPPASDWEVVSQGPMVLKVRSRPGTQIQEVWLATDLDASAADVQAALADNERLPKFMPHVREARTILKPYPDGGTATYVLLDLPMLGQRDYVVKTNVDSKLKPDGTGAFKSRWVATPDAIPTRHNIPRIRTNDGSWTVTPLGPSRSHVEYRAFLDPGGVPAVSVNSGNRKELPLALKALEAEAKRRSGGKPVDAGAETPPT